MNLIDLAERLSSMVDEADSAAGAKAQGIAREFTAAGRLQSGNFFIHERDSLKELYVSTLKQMEHHALNSVAPTLAGPAVRRAGRDLESKFLARFEAILGGSVSGNPCDEKAAAKLLDEYRRSLSNALAVTVSETTNNVPGLPIRGWRGWIKTYILALLGTLIAGAGAFMTWMKLN